MTSLLQFRKLYLPPVSGFVLACVGFLAIPKIFGTDLGGVLPGNNTADGSGVLLSRTSAVDNSGFGFQALNHDTTGSFNTATGIRALYTNVSGLYNTADGAFALALNTGSQNTATGYQALYSNTTGGGNTATGYQALKSNTTINGERGNENTATGNQALLHNTIGNNNTATGNGALYGNTTGRFNTAVGDEALLINTTGSYNTAIGTGAGAGITGSGNIYIGADVGGAAGENNITRIGNIGNTGQETGVYVTLDAVGGTKLGYVNLSCSRRFKQNIKPMEEASEAIFSLKPVRFRYKPEFDSNRAERFGLVAEDVEKINPDLVSHNERGDVTTVRYEGINAMLLNEFLKEHRRAHEQESTIRQLESTVAEQQKSFESKLAQQDKQIAALTFGLQKVSAQLEASKAPQMVASNSH